VQRIGFQPFEPADATFVGRERELAQLDAWWQRGGQTPAFVWGAWGMGKTSLIRRFTAQLDVSVAFARYRDIAAARPTLSGPPDLLVVDDVDRADLDMLDYTLRQIRAGSLRTRVLAAGRTPPSEGDWYRVEVGPLSNEAIHALLAPIHGLSSGAAQQITEQTNGSPVLAQMVGNRIQLSDGPEAVDELLRGLSWDETSLLRGVVSPAAASQLDVKVQSISDALVQRLAAEPGLMYELRPRQLEELMAELYARQGFEVELTPETRDGGVDLYLIQHTSYGRLLTVVDCKRKRADRPVKVEVVRQMLGTIEETGASAGVLVTTSRFTSGAIKLGEKYPFRLGLQDYFNLHSMLRSAAGPRPEPWTAARP